MGSDSLSEGEFDACTRQAWPGMVSPDSWPESGGGIREFKIPPLLIIEQTMEVHEEIAELLATLRKAKAERKKNRRPTDHAAKDDAADADEYQTLSAVHLEISWPYSS